MKTNTNTPVMKPSTKSCVVCGEAFYGHGSNPDPVAPTASGWVGDKTGLCCEMCDGRIVIPSRATWGRLPLSPTDSVHLKIAVSDRLGITSTN
jgi:hypothetical protein